MIDIAITLLLVAIAIGVSRGLRLGLESDLAVAVVRAIAQLAALAAVITLVFENPPYSALFIAVMLGAAAWTSGRRLEGIPGATWIALVAIGLASGVAAGVLFGFDVFRFVPRFLLPVVGMLIGNSMNAVSVAGKLLREDIMSKTLEIEARLALGVRARDALTPYVRRSMVTSLIPLVDATKNVGIILIPGGFVGMILGGASPPDAARVQAIILFMLLGSVSIAAMATAVLVTRAFIGPGERIVIPAALT
ncbi:MAG: ABC transporter permease [Actinobacteria bacterium]|nr:ABC transporter permease [Actinomycetota bacterium]